MAGNKGLNSTGKTANGVGGVTEHRELEIDDAYGTAIYYGDPVAVVSGYLTLCSEAASAAGTPIGVFRGCRYVDANGTLVFSKSYPASTTNFGSVAWQGGFSDKVVAEYEPAENHTFFIDMTDAAIARTDIGATKRLQTVGTQIGTTGKSACVVDQNASVTTELRLVRILGIAGLPDNNAMGTAATDTTVEVEFVYAVGDAT